MAKTPSGGAAWLAAAHAPEANDVRRAGALGVVAALVWPLQAALVAWCFQALLQEQASLSAIIFCATGYFLLGLLRGGVQGRSEHLLHAASTRLIARLRHRILERELCQSRFGGHQVSSSQVAVLVSEKLPLLSAYLTRFGPARLRVVVCPVVILLLAAVHSWVVALILLMAGPLIPVFMALVGWAAQARSERQMQELTDFSGLLQEHLTALTDIRLLGARTRAQRAFAQRSDSLRVRTMAVLRVAFLSSATLELFSALGVALVAVFVGFSLLGEIGFGAYATPLTPFEGIFLLLIAPDFFQPLRDLAAAWHDRAAALAVAEECAALEARQSQPLAGALPSTPPQPLASGPLRVRALTLSPAPGHVLQIPEFSVPEGGSLALLGPSGVGKSTLLAALAGLLGETRGHGTDITLGNTAFTEETAARWRATMIWLEQTPLFINASLRDNLCLGLTPRPRADQIDSALELAAARDVVARLPLGLTTDLHENGAGFSGGEARRLALTRAALRFEQGLGSVLLADEPTADLDDHTAAQVINGLLGLNQRGVTLIAATHDPRLSNALAQRLLLGQDGSDG